jgi:pimeloyl-ACP methyl ester carboxylesterase
MLVKTVDRAFEERGRKVTLIGHSLGGLLARGAAMERPESVARVITLGSPVDGIAANLAVLAAAQLAAADCGGRCLGSLQAPLSGDIDEVCIYTRSDGVVDWRTCLREDATNIEVEGTHTGLVCNARVYEALAAILGRQTASVDEFPRLAALPLRVAA